MITQLYQVPLYIKDGLLSEHELERLEALCVGCSENLSNYPDEYNPDIFKFSHYAGMRLDNLEEFDWITDKILKEMRIFLNGIGYSEKQIAKLFVCNSWFGVYKEGDYLPMHIHRGSVWSSAFYVTNHSPTKLKFIHRFYDSSPIPDDTRNIWSKNSEWIQCDRNRFIAFGSDQAHGLDKLERDQGFQEDIIKIMLSYNFAFRRP